MASTVPAPSRVGRRPNWAEFYKNGVPTEVIVLDDEDENEPECGAMPPAQPGRNHDDDYDRDQYYRHDATPIRSSALHSIHAHDPVSPRPPVPVDSRPAGKRRRTSPAPPGPGLEIGRAHASPTDYYRHMPPAPFPPPAPTHSHAFSVPNAGYGDYPAQVPAINAILSPVDSRLRPGTNHGHSTSSAYSSRSAAYPGRYVAASGPTGSSGQAALPPPPPPPSATFPPPTNGAINGSSNGNGAVPTSGPLAPLRPSEKNQLGQAGPAEPSAGQKRKRSSRQVAAEEVKRRELEAALAHYRAPPNPPIRTDDVYVPVINDRTTAEKKKVDDKDGHYMITPDTLLTERYRIVRMLGQGTFGKVVEAVDVRTKRRCAIKVIRAVQKYRDASRIELRVLATLAQNDRTNHNRCIHLRDCFDFRNHICIVTDLFGQSVFDFLKGNGFVPFPGSHIQRFAHQLITSVAFLHDLNLIHTDLKPENILLVENGYQTFTYNRQIPSSTTTINRYSRSRKVLLAPDIRLIDFGSATFEEEFHSNVVSTRHYRAPEIILELGWSFPCDMWSMACILVEFYTGDALFQTHDNLEHLAMMESVCNGPIDTDLVRAAIKPGRTSGSSQVSTFFRSNLRLNFPNERTPKASRHYVNGIKRLHEFIPPTTSFNRQFLDLLRRLFVYNPKKRLTAKQALQHPWFRETIVDDGTEAERIRARQLAAEARR